jgi:hypothetical protein
LSFLHRRISNCFPKRLPLLTEMTLSLQDKQAIQIRTNIKASVAQRLSSPSSRSSGGRRQRDIEAKDRARTSQGTHLVEDPPCNFCGSLEKGVTTTIAWNQNHVGYFRLGCGVTSGNICCRDFQLGRGRCQSNRCYVGSCQVKPISLA